MRYFWKLNVVSVVYGFLFFLVVELLLNIYRIHALTSWSFGIIYSFMIGTAILVFLLSSRNLHKLIRNWFGSRILVHWSLILWVPYAILLLCIFAVLVPIKDPDLVPGPGAGIIIFGLFFIHFIFIFLLNFFSLESEADHLPTEKG